jgi:hypothetical protein
VFRDWATEYITILVLSHLDPLIMEVDGRSSIPAGEEEGHVIGMSSSSLIPERHLMSRIVIRR